MTPKTDRELRRLILRFVAEGLVDSRKALSSLCHYLIPKDQVGQLYVELDNLIKRGVILKEEDGTYQTA